MEPDDRTYTLAEAERILAKRECFNHGHDFEVMIDNRTSDPAAIMCTRCGRSWTVK
jgi:hypothetical protein